MQGGLTGLKNIFGVLNSALRLIKGAYTSMENQEIYVKNEREENVNEIVIAFIRFTLLSGHSGGIILSKTAPSSDRDMGVLIQRGCKSTCNLSILFFTSH